MNQLSSRRSRLKFKTSGNLQIISEESIEYTSNEWKQNHKMSTCNWLGLESLRFDWLLEPNIFFVLYPYPNHTHQQWPMPIHALQIVPMYSIFVTLPIISHPCPPKTHGHEWAWVWAPNVGLCRLCCPKTSRALMQALEAMLANYALRWCKPSRRSFYYYY